MSRSISCCAVMFLLAWVVGCGPQHPPAGARVAGEESTTTTASSGDRADIGDAATASDLPGVEIGSADVGSQAETTAAELYSIDGIEPEPEPQLAPPPTPYVVEKYMRGGRGLDQFPKPRTPPQLLPEYRDRVKLERMLAKIRELQAQGLLPSDAEMQRQRRQAAVGKLEMALEVMPGDDTLRASHGDRFAAIYENPFDAVIDAPLSTFSIDVDTASYGKMRQLIMDYNRLPTADAVRLEELVNYFPYNYRGPQETDVPFAAHLEVARCPWEPAHRLARVGIKGCEVDLAERPGNLVFLLDISGSMSDTNKLPLVKRGIKLLVEELGEDDSVAIVVYAETSTVALPPTAGSNKQKIVAVIDRLQAGGSTNGGAGIQTAYALAKKQQIEGGINRVILCTDGDFNVGVTGVGELVALAEKEAEQGVFLSVLGFGTGNLNDAMLEDLSGKADGNYAFIDSIVEAKKVLVEQMGGTLITIAKDVKIQIEFNPAKVKSYRLLGYENRLLAAEDFNDDTRDAGEIGAGHTVTALYELVPAHGATPGVDPLKYQRQPVLAEAANSDELLTLKLRYKLPAGDQSQLLERAVIDESQPFRSASEDFQFAAAVASFGMLLRGSPHRGNSNFDTVLEIAVANLGDDESGYRREFVKLVEKASGLAAR